MNSTWYTDWRVRWEEASQRLQAVDPAEGLTEPDDIVRAINGYNFRLHALNNTAKAMLNIVEHAPYKLQVYCCAGCQHAGYPCSDSGVMERLEAVMMGEVRCHKGCMTKTDDVDCPWYRKQRREPRRLSDIRLDDVEEYRHNRPHRA